MKPYIELVSSKTKPEVPSNRVLAAAEEVNISSRAGGFIARHLGYAEENGLWHDILWPSAEGDEKRRRAAALRGLLPADRRTPRQNNALPLAHDSSEITWQNH